MLPLQKTTGRELSRTRALSSLSYPVHSYGSPTKQRTERLRSILLFNQTKKWSSSVLFAKRRIKQLYSKKLEWSCSILVDSPTKRILGWGAMGNGAAPFLFSRCLVSNGKKEWSSSGVYIWQIFGMLLLHPNNWMWGLSFLFSPPYLYGSSTKQWTERLRCILLFNQTKNVTILF
jgi:hypothetical protein